MLSQLDRGTLDVVTMVVAIVPAAVAISIWRINRAQQGPLFWMLAIIAYGCVAAAIVIFVGSDGRVMDSLADRNSTAWLAMCGLATAVAAWAVARRVGRRR